MKTLYHVVLHRPKGSSTWTPYKCKRPAGNFFVSRGAAEDWVSESTKDGCSVYCPGPKKYVQVEFKIGRVVVDLAPTEAWLTPKLKKQVKQ